jgi:hypothetical protein
MPCEGKTLPKMPLVEFNPVGWVPVRVVDN